MKRWFCVLSVLLILAGFCGCAARSSVTVGSGTPGKVETVPWGEYDALLKKISAETDQELRTKLLHQAEDMLLESGAVIPLYHNINSYLLKPDVTGVYCAANSVRYFYRIRQEGVSPSVPLRLNVITEVSSFDSSMESAADCFYLGANTFSGLFTCTEDGQYVCDLAESYTVSEDGMTYEFLLKPDLTWSDGTPLTAEDFVYAWKRNAATETAASAGYLYDVIAGYPNDLAVSASEDGRTLTVHLAAPCAYFIDLCSRSYFFPLLRREVENAPGYKDASGKVVNPAAWASEAPIITNGPYTIERWQHNESVTLKKNPLYHRADEVPTETLELMLTSDTSAAYSAYLADDICCDFNIPGDMIPLLLGTPEFHVVRSNGTIYFCTNVNSDLFAGMTAEEARIFRRALGTAIDREFLRDVAIASGVTAATTMVPPYATDGLGRPFGETDEKEVPYYSEKADPEKAREMLRSIGFRFGKDGKLLEPITIEYLYSSTGSNDAIATCLQADLAQLGIRLTLSSMEWSVFLGEINAGRYTTARGSWNSDFNDPFGMLCIFASDSSNNIPRLGK